MVTPPPDVRADDDRELTFQYAIQEADRGATLSRPGSIDVDTLRGEVYLTDTGRKAVFVYDESGKFLQRIPKGKGIQDPRCLRVNPGRGFVIGEQDSPRLWFLDLNGKVVPEYPAGVALPDGGLPGGMFIDAQRDVWVVDRFGEAITRIHAAEHRTERIDVPLGGEEEDIELQDILVLGDGRTVLLSSKGSAVHVLDPSGRPQLRFGVHGSMAHHFSFPVSFALGPDGNLWIVDTFQHAIKVFDLNGTFIREFGEMGIGSGHFFFPIGIAFGRGGKVFVLEKGIPRFQIFQMGR